ncbi:MarR family winged helix-turn-helix transcriptional regulator [Bdellovibrio sp.]|uniref:MarR family winged helix-turn-helix transcriptional regulator n=1 Tax=Bdellovibrio sp. TaxID=28201 RepID=UPI0039C8B994
MKISKFIERSPVVPTLLVAEAISRDLDTRLKTFDLSISEALILVGVFFEDKEARPSELAKTLRISRSRLSQCLSRLITAGYLNRKIESQDARFINIQITSQGKHIALKLIKIFDDQSTRIEAKVGVRKAEALAESLLKVFE